MKVQSTTVSPWNKDRPQSSGPSRNGVEDLELQGIPKSNLAKYIMDRGSRSATIAVPIAGREHSVDGKASKVVTKPNPPIAWIENQAHKPMTSASVPSKQVVFQGTA